MHMNHKPCFSKCHIDTCNKHAKHINGMCKKHHCRNDCAESKETCLIHICNVDGCGNNTGVVDGYCLMHLCLHAECCNMRVNDRYCLEHTCKNNACKNGISEKSLYCNYHWCGCVTSKVICPDHCCTGGECGHIRNDRGVLSYPICPVHRCIDCSANIASVGDSLFCASCDHKKQ